MESPNLKTNQSSSSSHYIKTICLRDWWLIKSVKEVEGKSLAVAGLTSTGKRAVRVFSSSPIIKRYDVFTLETADGICIVVKGFINKLRTCENGFSSEVFKDFLFGFPPNWEKYATGCLENECTTTVDLMGKSGFESCDKLNMGSGEETPSKDIRLISKDTRSIKDIPDETNVTVEANVNIKSANEDDNIHLVACKLSSAEIPKDCVPGKIPGKITDNASKESNSPNNMGGRLIRSNLKSQKGNQKESLASRSFEDDNEAFKTPNEKKLKRKSSDQNEKKDRKTEGAGIHGTKRKLKFDIHSQKGKQKESLASRSFTKDNGNEHNSAEEAFKTPNEKKLKRKSYTQIEKKDSKPEGASIHGTKRKLKFYIHESPSSHGNKKTPAISPETMSLKRSRSGRLLVPALDFWRNQKAHYDKHGQITAIQDGPSVVEISRDLD